MPVLWLFHLLVWLLFVVVVAVAVAIAIAKSAPPPLLLLIRRFVLGLVPESLYDVAQIQRLA